MSYYREKLREDLANSLPGENHLYMRYVLMLWRIHGWKPASTENHIRTVHYIHDLCQPGFAWDADIRGMPVPYVQEWAVSCWGGAGPRHKQDTPLWSRSTYFLKANSGQSEQNDARVRGLVGRALNWYYRSQYYPHTGYQLPIVRPDWMWADGNYSTPDLDMDLLKPTWICEPVHVVNSDAPEWVYRTTQGNPEIFLGTGTRNHLLRAYYPMFTKELAEDTYYLLSLVSNSYRKQMLRFRTELRAVKKGISP